MKVYDSKLKKEVEVFSNYQKSLSFFYETAIGRILLKIVICPWISKLYGFYQHTSLSKWKIKSFIKKNHIDMSEYPLETYSSFNSFFIRKIRPEKRPISFHENDFISCCDGKATLYPVTKDLVFSVKGSSYSVASILRDRELAKRYEGGSCLVLRLSVDDYHHYSFFDSGVVEKTYAIGGRLHTVNPIVYSKFSVFSENSRVVSVLKTDHFGTVTQVEVGALMVGKIVNYPVFQFERGQEKGYFEFGGSTIVLFIEKNQVRFLPFLPKYSGKMEVKVQLGSVLGHAISRTRK